MTTCKIQSQDNLLIRKTFFFPFVCVVWVVNWRFLFLVEENKCFRRWHILRGHGVKASCKDTVAEPSCQTLHPLLQTDLHIRALHHTFHWKSQQKLCPKALLFSRTWENNTQRKFTTTSTATESSHNSVPQKERVSQTQKHQQTSNYRQEWVLLKRCSWLKPKHCVDGAPTDSHDKALQKTK